MKRRDSKMKKGLFLKLMVCMFIAGIALLGAAGTGKAASETIGVPPTTTIPHTLSPSTDSSSPLYVNRTPGALHMLGKRAADGFYYSYDGAANNWTIFRSEDGITWTSLGEGTGYPNGTLGQANFWVPEVVEYEGKYYMFYCARENASTPSSRIWLAISDSPAGPFYDIGRSIFEGSEMEDWHIIDPNPFIDPDTGKKYIYFSKDGNGVFYYNEDLKTSIEESRIFGVELSDDMMSAAGNPVELLKPEQEWEYKSYRIDGKRLWNEAPEIFKRNGTYYLMYSGNLFSTMNYGLGVATSTNPLGPFTKYVNNPVAGSTEVSQKAGHNSITISPDGSELFTSFTTWDDGRYMNRMGFREDGTLYVNGPIKGYQEKPSGSQAYHNYAKEAQVRVSSAKSAYSPEAVIDGEIGINDTLEQYEWSSNGEKTGAWIRLSWEKPQLIEYILLYDSALNSRKLASGHLVFNDNPNEVIADIPFPAASGDPAAVQLAKPMLVNSITFYVDGLVDPNGTAGLSEITVLGKGAFSINDFPDNTLKIGDDFFDLQSDAMNEPNAAILLQSLLKEGVNQNKVYFKSGGKWYNPFELQAEEFLNPSSALTEEQTLAITGFNKWYKAQSSVIKLP